VSFAKKYELLPSSAVAAIKLTELDYSDPEALARAIPSRAQLVVVEGDVVDGKPVDERVRTAAAAAAGGFLDRELVAEDLPGWLPRIDRFCLEMWAGGLERPPSPQ
jgi:hypothetical protein